MVERIISSTNDPFGEEGSKSIQIYLEPETIHSQINKQWILDCSKTKQEKWKCNKIKKIFMSLKQGMEKSIQVHSEGELNYSELIEATEYVSAQKPLSWNEEMYSVYAISGAGYHFAFGDLNDGQGRLFVEVIHEDTERLFFINWDKVNLNSRVSISCDFNYRDKYLIYKKAPNESEGALNEK